MLIGVTIHAHQPKILKVPPNEKFTSLQLFIYGDSAHFLHLAGYSLIVVVLLFEYK